MSKHLLGTIYMPKFVQDKKCQDPFFLRNLYDAQEIWIGNLKQLNEHFNAKLPLLLLSVKIIQRNQLKLKYQNKLKNYLTVPQNPFNGRLLKNYKKNQFRVTSYIKYDDV